MEEKGFKLDAENSILRNHYENNPNYYIDEVGSGTKCFIFFSSNGLYYPNDEISFRQSIIVKDRYEWQNVGKSLEVTKQSKKIIYVRDIYKQFYINGINSKTDTIDELCRFLKEIIGDMSVITCGTSSGGYMAVIAGIYLQAECIFSFGGIWSLKPTLEQKTKQNFNDSYYFIGVHENNDQYNKYFDISSLLVHNKVPIMYFYSALNAEDKEQLAILERRENIENIYFFAMKSKYHGYLMFNSCYKKVLSVEFSKLVRLCKKNSKKNISLRKWCLYLLPCSEALKEIMKDIINDHKSLQFLKVLFR